MKNNRFLSLLKVNRLTVAVLFCCTALFAIMYFYANRQYEQTALEESDSYRKYEKAKVVSVLEDTSEKDPDFENKYVGNQTLELLVESGEYQGVTVSATNYLGALYGSSMKAGDSVIIVISVAEDEISAVVVYEYNRILPMVFIIALFFGFTIWVGGKRGALSLAGLTITICTLFFVLIPLLMAGFPTLPTVFLTCVYVAVFSFALIGGVSKKTVCATLGTVLGIGVAVVFGLLSQWLLRVDGMRMGDYVDALLQLKKAGLGIRLSGLLLGGVIISSLGAVMDVAMSISSSLSELIEVNPQLTKKEIWRSGMNIGRDMIGTMTNTLILAFVGSSFLLVIYLWSLELPFYELFSSSMVACELIHGIASSIGIVLSVPFTVFIGTIFLYNSSTKC
jgi:uncharacterized membrane protein